MQRQLAIIVDPYTGALDISSKESRFHNENGWIPATTTPKQTRLSETSGPIVLPVRNNNVGWHGIRSVGSDGRRDLRLSRAD